MADQATSTSERSSIVADPETPATAGATVAAEPASDATAEASASHGFGTRGRMRRRLRFLRKARELGYRDLGGLVFEMQRLGERRDELAAAKLATLAAIDTELRALEDVLGDRRPLTILRESGIAACPRCAAIHGSDDRFCPACGLAMERRAERPIAAPAAGPALATTTASPPTTAPPTAAPPAASPPTAAPPAAGPRAASPPTAAAPAAAPPASPPPAATRRDAVAPTPPVARPATTYRPVAAQGPASPQPPPASEAPAGTQTPPGTGTPATRQAVRPEPDDRPTEIIRPPGASADEGA